MSTKVTSFKEALRAASPVFAAYFPLGIALGVLATSLGLAWFWAPLFSLFVFAGSVEFVAVSLVASSSPLIQLALATLLINFRHVFYGFGFPIRKLHSRGQKIYGVYTLTDEAFAITSTPIGAHLDGKAITYFQLLTHLYWFSGTLVGSLLGAVIPPSVHGFDFALTAMFAVLFLSSRAHNKRWTPLLLAVGCAALALALQGVFGSRSFLVVGMGSYFCACTVWFWLLRRADRSTHKDDGGLGARTPDGNEVGDAASACLAPTEGRA